MLFTPTYSVIYHGVFHEAGKRFEINDEDAAEMGKHGIVEQAAEKPVRKPGRPKKTEG